MGRFFSILRQHIGQNGIVVENGNCFRFFPPYSIKISSDKIIVQRVYAGFKMCVAIKRRYAAQGNPVIFHDALGDGPQMIVPVKFLFGTARKKRDESNIAGEVLETQ